MKQGKMFDHGAPREAFEKLCDFMDANDFTCADFLACVCAHLSGLPQNEFETELMVAGRVFKIKIEKQGIM